MVTVESFIESKSNQLVYYVRAFWDERIPYNEVNLYFWDTMEEWVQIETHSHEPESQKERVFWHLLHQLHFWSEEKLREDQFLRLELLTCVKFLEGEQVCPLDCVGVRP
ncbi:hypothetical protein HJG39_02360 [Alteromonas sp. a30]|nr:hypothetical protein [Alteromonas sp. a30]